MDKILDYLNNLLELDNEGINKLFTYYVKVNEGSRMPFNPVWCGIS